MVDTNKQMIQPTSVVEVYDLREAAWYLGCSTGLVKRARRSGWLRSIEDLKSRTGRRSNLPTLRAHFLRQMLDRFARDIAMSLSMFDLLAIRIEDASAKDIAKFRGIPGKTCELIRQSDFAAAVTKELGDYARERKADVRDIRSLARNASNVTDQGRGHRRERELSPQQRRWKQWAKPVSLLNVPASAVFERPTSLTEVARKRRAIDQRAVEF